jgi:hypothetical protein
MKISTYHKLRGDFVQFVKGCNPSLREQKWERIYISTLFTFHWSTTTKTIKYYSNSVNSPKDIFVGGVMATLLADEIQKEYDVTIITGLIDRPGILDSDDHYIIDDLIPDYKILDEIEYDYGLKDAYIGYATRGCPNRCKFCAVHQLEPQFVHYTSLKKQIKGIEEIYGPKKDLLLLDNNVLASQNYETIINDIIELGFYKGATFNNRLRKLDFNQGIDARLLTPEKMELLAKTAIRPLRIAFDFIEMKELYISRVKLATEHGIKNLSNYVLYNYVDTPEDFYERLCINVNLNKELGIHLYSFPMKYVPLDAKDRSYIGKHWNKRLLRGVQCILLATGGKISPSKAFFGAAFGATPQEFIKIAMMPDEYIIYREEYKNNGAYDWRILYEKLNRSQRNTLVEILSRKSLEESVFKEVPPSNLRKLLVHYVEANKIGRLRRKQGKKAKAIVEQNDNE